MVSLCLADSTSWAWATMCDASALFHMTAQELHDLRLVSETKFHEKINKVQFTEAVFTMTAKVETFNQAPQLKFTVQDVEPVGWGQEEGGRHIKRRWLEIMELEKQLGVSHEEEYGIAVSGCAAFNIE